MSRSKVLCALLTALLLVGANAADAREKLDNDNVAGDQYSDPQLRPEILPGSETTLPTRPEEVTEKLQPSGSAAPPVLKGAADTTAINLNSRAELLAANPLSRYRGDSLVFFKVHIKNSGSTPVLVLGRDAQFVTPSATVKTIRAATLENHDNVLLTPKEKVLVGAVGIGSAGLASSIFYEHMTPSENKHRSLGIALGRDRGRHEVESENLGTRLVMPGDETNGWLAFEDSANVRQQNTLRVPVMFPPYSTVSANLAVPVTAVGAPLSPPDMTPGNKQ
ncbi:MAG: hypothetical protein SGJ27_00200 [Candidatus Melainabacteria bacterium]|nr:hypothetical protein [Candidatus Melainabacteria bacterium]